MNLKKRRIQANEEKRVYKYIIIYFQFQMDSISSRYPTSISSQFHNIRKKWPADFQ